MQMADSVHANGGATMTEPQPQEPLLPMEKILPCPFCKAHHAAHLQGAHLTNLLSTYWVRCHNCGACGPRREIGPLAITAWNNRANAKAAELAALRQENEALKAIRTENEQWISDMADAVTEAEKESEALKAELAWYKDALIEAGGESVALQERIAELEAQTSANQ